MAFMWYKAAFFYYKGCFMVHDSFYLFLYNGVAIGLLSGFL